jgi:hypothetical protein
MCSEIIKKNSVRASRKKASGVAGSEGEEQEIDFLLEISRADTVGSDEKWRSKKLMPSENKLKVSLKEYRIYVPWSLS